MERFCVGTQINSRSHLRRCLCPFLRDFKRTTLSRHTCLMEARSRTRFYSWSSSSRLPHNIQTRHVVMRESTRGNRSPCPPGFYVHVWCDRKRICKDLSEGSLKHDPPPGDKRTLKTENKHSAPLTKTQESGDFVALFLWKADAPTGVSVAKASAGIQHSDGRKALIGRARPPYRHASAE